jgi:hypothetical protein
VAAKAQQVITMLTELAQLSQHRRPLYPRSVPIKHFLYDTSGEVTASQVSDFRRLLENMVRGH